MRHSRRDEESLPTALTLKLYSIVSTEFFLWNMPVVTKTFAAISKLFKLSEDKVIPPILRFRIITVFIDDNLDQNSNYLSGTQLQHFHGSSVTVLQFPTEEEPGVNRIRPSYEALSEEERLVDISVLDSFTEVVDGNYSVKNAICPIQTINIPEQLAKEVTESFYVGLNLKEEMKWAEKSVNLIGSEITKAK